MDIELFNYYLPEKLIAHEPVTPRDSCRLLCYTKSSDKYVDIVFREIIDYLQEGDVLVFNNSKVIPSRTYFTKESGGIIEVFFVGAEDEYRWKIMVRGKVRPGIQLYNKQMNVVCEVLVSYKELWIVHVSVAKTTLLQLLEKYGEMPLPPYIHNNQDRHIVKEEYQTVYSKNYGSVAAPTAGLHFTQGLLDSLRARGIQLEWVTLHVGLGTFAPVRVKDIRDHELHEEYVEVDSGTMKRIYQAQSENRRIIAVGTTSVRVLESVFSHRIQEEREVGYIGNVNIFIYPGYVFNIVKGIITNFHLPKSSLIMLVSAFVGYDRCMELYKHAVDEEYRFYSFGDAMFIIE